MFHLKSFENIWSFIFYAVEAGETELRNTLCVEVRCTTVHDSRITSEMSWGSIHTKINMNP